MHDKIERLEAELAAVKRERDQLQKHLRDAMSALAVASMAGHDHEAVDYDTDDMLRVQAAGRARLADLRKAIGNG